MKANSTIIFILFISASTHAQNNKLFNDFIKLFPKSSLPAAIQYSHDEFDYGYYSPEDSGEERDSTNNFSTKDAASIEYQNNVLPKPDSLIIKDELVKLFLLADTENITQRWPGNDPASDTVYPTYYISTRLITRKPFLCLVYERQSGFGSDEGAEKFLCTLTKNGKLIDKLLVASAVYSGTGILGEGFRVPYFPDVKSIINKDLEINFNDNDAGERRYQVDNNGKIIKK